MRATTSRRRTPVRSPSSFFSDASAAADTWTGSGAGPVDFGVRGDRVVPRVDCVDPPPATRLGAGVVIARGGGDAGTEVDVPDQPGAIVGARRVGPLPRTSRRAPSASPAATSTT